MTGISMIAARRIVGRLKSEKTKKPDPYGRTLVRAMPLRQAPMASSRTPKWKLRPPQFMGLGPCSLTVTPTGPKSPNGLSPFSLGGPSRVRVDGARSADPPISHGTALATSLSTLLEADRPATPFASVGNVGRDFSHPSGN